MFGGLEVKKEQARQEEINLIDFGEPAKEATSQSKDNNLLDLLGDSTQPAANNSGNLLDFGSTPQQQNNSNTLGELDLMNFGNSTAPAQTSNSSSSQFDFLSMASNPP